MKDKLFIIVGVIAFLICCGVGLYYMEYYDEMYYSQIDNSKVIQISSNDNMKYEYTLDCYSKTGKKKTLKFKTSRELKEDAYIELEVKILGVHKWREMQYDELPVKVQEKLK